MTNFLDIRCPKCGDEDRLDIQATVWIRVCEDGTDADAAGDGSHDYEPDSPAQCGACGHCGTVQQFEHREDASTPAPALKHYRVLYSQESSYKVDVPATSVEHAMAFVEDALARGLDLDATAFDGNFSVVSADAIEEGGAA